MEWPEKERLDDLTGILRYHRLCFCGRPLGTGTRYFCEDCSCLKCGFLMAEPEGANLERSITLVSKRPTYDAATQIGIQSEPRASKRPRYDAAAQIRTRIRSRLKGRPTRAFHVPTNMSQLSSSEVRPEGRTSTPWYSKRHTQPLGWTRPRSPIHPSSGEISPISDEETSLDTGTQSQKGKTAVRREQPVSAEVLGPDDGSEYWWEASGYRAFTGRSREEYDEWIWRADEERSLMPPPTWHIGHAQSGWWP